MRKISKNFMNPEIERLISILEEPSSEGFFCMDDKWTDLSEPECKNIINSMTDAEREKFLSMDFSNKSLGFKYKLYLIKELFEMPRINDKISRLVVVDEACVFDDFIDIMSTIRDYSVFTGEDIKILEPKINNSMKAMGATIKRVNLVKKKWENLKK